MAKLVENVQLEGGIRSNTLLFDNLYSNNPP